MRTTGLGAKHVKNSCGLHEFRFISIAGILNMTLSTCADAHEKDKGKIFCSSMLGWLWQEKLVLVVVTIEGEQVAH